MSGSTLSAFCSTLSSTQHQSGPGRWALLLACGSGDRCALAKLFHFCRALHTPHLLDKSPSYHTWAVLWTNIYSLLHQFALIDGYSNSTEVYTIIMQSHNIMQSTGSTSLIFCNHDVLAVLDIHPHTNNLFMKMDFVRSSTIDSAWQ